MQGFNVSARGFNAPPRTPTPAPAPHPRDQVPAPHPRDQVPHFCRQGSNPTPLPFFRFLVQKLTKKTCDASYRPPPLSPSASRSHSHLLPWAPAASPSHAQLRPRLRAGQAPHPSRCSAAVRHLPSQPSSSSSSSPFYHQRGRTAAPPVEAHAMASRILGRAST